MLENTSKAIELAHDICVYAHTGQVDKAGRPYHFHPEYVADHVEGETEKVVALLHDVMEDTDFPLSVLEQLFSKEVIEALKLLCHDPNVEYMEYIKLLKDNAAAKAVKTADLNHNMQLDRLPLVCSEDIARLSKYKKALKLLQEAD